MPVPIRVGGKLPLSLQGLVNLLGRNRSFLYESVRENRHGLPVKEIKHPVVLPLKSDPKLIDTVPKEIGLWPAKFKAKLGQPLDSDAALGHRLGRKRVEPFEDRDFPVVLAVQNDLGSGQCLHIHYSQNCEDCQVESDWVRVAQ